MDNSPREHEESRESDLVRAAVAGDQKAIEALIIRHKPWIYRLSLRMTWNRADAEDATQEILLRAILKLDTFEGRSAFRTWLYRLAVNKLSSMRKSAAEAHSVSFDEYGEALDRAPHGDLPKIAESERQLLVEEAKVGCMTGMLLCLDRVQRLVYILGSVFELSDAVCAEILDIQPATFRKRLSRARADLHSFMTDKCGLLQKSNPCRCAHKTRAFIDMGYVDPDNLKFVSAHAVRARDAAARQAGRLYEAATVDYPRLFREQPLADPPGILSGLRASLVDTPFADLFQSSAESASSG